MRCGQCATVNMTSTPSCRHNITLGRWRFRTDCTDRRLSVEAGARTFCITPLPSLYMPLDSVCLSPPSGGYEDLRVRIITCVSLRLQVGGTHVQVKEGFHPYPRSNGLLEPKHTSTGRVALLNRSPNCVNVLANLQPDSHRDR